MGSTASLIRGYTKVNAVIAMKYVPFALIGILLVSLVAVHQAGGASSETISDSARAKGLLLALDRLANYTHIVNCTSPDGDALRERAWELFREGDYNESIEMALKAMDAYRFALEFCGTGNQSNVSEESFELIAEARVELGITETVLEYARSLMESGELVGDNLKLVESHYNRTLKIYEKLREALERNDTRDLRRDIALLRSSRERLEEAIDTAVMESIREKARIMGEVQLRRIDMLMGMGFNSTELLKLRADLEEAIREGDSERVLEILQEITRVLFEGGPCKIGWNITHTMPGRPSFPGNPAEDIPGMPDNPFKKTPQNGTGNETKNKTGEKPGGRR